MPWPALTLFFRDGVGSTPWRCLSFCFLRIKLPENIDLSMSMAMIELDEIQSVRERYLQRLLSICAVIGLPLLAVGVGEAVEIGLSPASLFYVAL